MLTKIFRQIKFVYINYINSSPERKRKYLIKQGARIGKGTRFFCNTAYLGSEPYLIEIGEDCVFATGTRFITHDGGVNILNHLRKFEKNGENILMDKIAPIKIGNNVYTGIQTVILPGVTIGDNVVIGAYSVVTRDIPSNSVVAGVPAKFICSIEEYYQKSLSKVEPTKTMSKEQKKEFYLKKYNLK